jgi:hypothetical protein
MFKNRVQVPDDVLVLDFAELQDELAESGHFQSVMAFVADHKVFRKGFNAGQFVIDTDLGNFFARQLEYISMSIRTQLFSPKKFRELIPFSPDQPDIGAESYTWYQESKQGIAKPGSSYSNQAPRVEVGTVGPFTSPIRPLTAAYGYSLQEVRAAQRVNNNLIVRKALNARRSIEFGLNDIAFFGDSGQKIPGLIAPSTVTGVTIVEVTTGSNSKKTWADKIANGHPEEVLADLNKMANSVVEQSDGNIIPTTILLPLAQYNLISSAPISTLTLETILQRFLQNSAFVKEVTWAPELKAAAATGAAPAKGGNALDQNGKDIALCYNRDPMTVNQKIPLDFSELPPQLKDYETIINCEARSGGTVWEQPLGGLFTFGI